MLTFAQVLHARLGSLEEAVTDWGQTHDKLKALGEQADSGMRAKADKARWEGANAGVTRPFVKKTAKEFADAAAVAGSITFILRDALAEFKAAKRALEKIVDEAPRRGIRIDANGGVSHLVHPDRRSGSYDGPTPQQADFDGVRSALQAAVERADDADDVANRALRAVVGTDEHDFSGTRYRSLEEASKVQDAEDAKLAAALVKKGDEATAKEIDRLNRLFKDNADDPYFAERLALEVGGRGTLAYWADLGDPSDASRLGIDHRDKLQELQKNYSMALAAATHSTSPEMQAWKAEVISAGDDPVRTRGASPYGFQVMSALMRHGSFEKSFLHDYGSALVAAERKMTRNGMVAPTQAWMTHGGMPRLNWDGRDLGRDPMVGFMEALGHHPRAATEFFSGGFDLPADHGEGKEKLNAFDYFTQGREWPEDVVADGTSAAHGYDSLGHALEAAVLGASHDDPNARLSRDGDTAELMERVVERYGGDPALLRRQESLADSLGRMAAGYVDDINWSMNENDPTSMFAPRKGEGGRPEPGHAEFGMDATRQFLSALGKHPDAYAEIAKAEQVCTVSMLEAQVGADGAVNEAHAREAVRSIGEVQGLIDQARVEQVRAEGLAADEAYNKAQAKRAGWINFGSGVVIAAGAAFLPPVAAVGVAATLIPVAQDAGTGVVGQLVNGVVGDYVDSNQKDSGEDVQKQRKAIFDAGELNAAIPMRVFMEHHGVERDSAFGQDLEEALKGGHLWGRGSESAHGSLPQDRE